MARIKVEKILAGVNSVFGFELRLITKCGTLKMHNIPETELIYIHAKTCANCKHRYNEVISPRTPTLPIIEALQLLDPIIEVTITISDDEALYYGARVLTKSGRSFLAIPSSAIAIGMSHHNKPTFYVEEDLLERQRQNDKNATGMAFLLLRRLQRGRKTPFGIETG